MTALESRDFLASCLRAALEDPDLVDAIADQALEEGLNAVVVAKGTVSVDRLKDLLFLTSEEAQLFYNVCSAMVKEDGAHCEHTEEPLSVLLNATPSGHVSLRFGPKRQLPKSVSVSRPVEAAPALASVPGPQVLDGSSTGPDSPLFATAEDPVADIPAAEVPSPEAPAPDAPTLAAAASGSSHHLGDLAPVEPEQPDTANVGEASLEEAFVPVDTEHEVMDSTALVVVSRASPALSKKQLETAVASSSVRASPAPSSKKLEAATVAPSSVRASPAPSSKILEAATVAPSSARASPAPSSKKLEVTAAVTPSSAPAPSGDAPLAPAPSDSPAFQTPSGRSPKPRVPKPTPSPASATRPKSAIPKPPGLALPSEASAPAVMGSASPALSSSSTGSTPSYLRATAAHKARTAKEESPVSPALAPVPEEHKLNRRRSLFERVTSTLLAPTQAFVARVTGRNEEVKAKKQSPVTRASVQLDTLLSSPAGQRVTKPQPFALASGQRGKSTSCMLTTEELQMAEAREKAWRRAPVPKHVHEARPIVPTVRSEPKNPQAIFKPFQLASVELHNKKVEEKRRKEEEAAKAEEAARQFRARNFNARIAAGPVTPPKPVASPTTRGVAPVFASEARIAHYHEVVEPAKKAKEAEAEKERLEAERKAKELEDLSVEDFRKTLEFKARPMPDFSAPFRPDLSQAKSVTASVEFQLHTVKRLGAAPSPGAREDKEGPGLGHGVYDGAGYVDPFSASLRKSTSMAAGSGSAGNSMAVRRSATVRQSAAAAYGRNTGAGVRGSVGSALQAAIRIAARDAARELEAREAAASPRGCGAHNGRNKGGSQVGSPAVAAN